MKPLLILLSALTLSAQWQQLDQAIEQEVKLHQLPALSLAITDAGQTLHQKHTNASPSTPYRAGSITKLFTAIAIMQLVEAGKLDLDQPISRYLPELDYPSTLRQILAHRSGIVREPGRGHYFDTQPTSFKQVTASLRGVKLIYPPGTTTKYSNAAYTLLGDVIERTTNQTYADYLQQHLFTPLGLAATRLSLPKDLPPSIMWTTDGRTFPAPTFELGLVSAGNLVTTTEDLLRFARWLMRDDTRPVLKRTTLDEMWQPQAGGENFGLGFQLNAESVSHAGAVYGHSALLRVRRNRQWAAVAFTTKDSADFALRSLIRYAPNPQGAYTPSSAPSFPQLSQYSAEPAPFPSRALAEYGWDFNKLYLLEHAGKLHCLIEWFSLAQLIPIAPNHYRFPPNSMYAGEDLIIKTNGLTVGPVWFPRLPAPNRNFRIVMQKPLAELRRLADQSTPPVQSPDLRQPDLVNLRTLDPGIQFDIRYATANNFMGAPLYSQKAAYLQRPAAQALLAAHQALKAKGFGLLIHDAYRPWRVTKMFWEATPEKQRNFVANPASGSRHNRGCAVDLSLYDLKTGKPVQMPSGFDEFSDRAFPDYPGGTSHERWLRALLRTTMGAQGFTVNDDEWWHYDFRDWKQYPVLNISFEQLGSR
jgi:D-alanyl-D-alanine dipeptidase/CubicO group peptidase (beta-lactamase class C family)